MDSRFAPALRGGTIWLVAIPDYQSIMLPLLTQTSDSASHRTRDLIPSLANHFSLTQAEQEQLLPSGAQGLFDNRVNWAATYLKKAGLLESPSRGHIRMTQQGMAVMAAHPTRIDNAFLSQFPSFLEFRMSAPAAATPKAAAAESESRTPEETLEGTWSALRNSLGQDLLAKIKAGTPQFFERLVVDLLVGMGYGGSVSDAGATLGGTGDGGLDGVIKEDKLGLDVVYIQAKRWEGSVGRPTVQAFAGSLDGARARKGVMITTSTFSSDAQAYARQIEKRIVLIDGATLVNLMMDHRVGVATARTYEVQKLDLDYFDED